MSCLHPFDDTFLVGRPVNLSGSLIKSATLFGQCITAAQYPALSSAIVMQFHLGCFIFKVIFPLTLKSVKICLVSKFEALNVTM